MRNNKILYLCLGTLVRTPSHKNSKSKRRMTPGSTRKNLDFDNSQRSNRSRRVSTLRKSPSFKQSDRRRSLGSTRKTLRFSKSKSRTRNSKTRKRPNLGPPRRVLTRKIKGSPKRVKRKVRKTPNDGDMEENLKKRRRRRSGGHHSLFGNII